MRCCAVAALAGVLGFTTVETAPAQRVDFKPPPFDVQYLSPIEDSFEFSTSSLGSLQTGSASSPGELMFEPGLPDRGGDLLTPNGPISPYLVPGAHGGPRREPWMTDADGPPSTYCGCLTRLGFRHSYTHGRNVGWGQPLVGTSWLNRPYFVGGMLGPLWMTRWVEDSVPGDSDVIGRLLVGWDWDHYWGSEFEYSYATPELVNGAAPSAQRGDRSVHWNYSLMYYPWGDANIRPYWRLGVGDTRFDFPNDAGVRRDRWLLAFPIGIGLKYPLRRWLAARAELTDYLAVGAGGVATQHILALTFGLEYRFGARPKSYWPWYPSRHIW